MKNIKTGQRDRAGLLTGGGGVIVSVMGKTTPLADIHRAHGAEFVEQDGWILPARFGAPIKEYEAVRSAVGLLDLCDYAAVELTGPDCVFYLQGMITNDVKSLCPGAGMYAAVVDVNGKILADLRVLCVENSTFVLLMREPLKDKVITQLNKYLVADDVEIVDHAGRYGLISLQGPHALLLLTAVAPHQDPPVHMVHHRLLRVGDRPLRAIRSTHTGEEGFDLLIQSGDLRFVASELERAGTALAFRWTGLEALEILRVEAGLPRYGVDMDEDNLLLETGLDSAVSFNKGCYVGQEVIERVRSRGHVNRKLAGIALKGESPAQRGDKIHADGKEIGRITSAVFSPRLNHAIALGYIHRGYLQTGTSVSIDRDGAEVGGTVTTLPFVFSTSP
ncbi:MAG: aminomethyltransferase family protein [Candidatus Binatia bacterium]